MIFRGLQKTTLIDYPGHVAATFFVDKCNFRCPYCHNPRLVFETETNEITEEEALEFLEKRKKLIDGICVTGGEPTLHPGLKFFFQKAKGIGLKIKLDSNGTNPGFLKELIEEGLVDFVAMDVKAPLEKYGKATGVKADTGAVKESIELLKKGKVDYEFRATVVPGIIELEDIPKMGKLVEGAKKFVFQQFVSGLPVVSKEFESKSPYPLETLKEMKKEMEKFVEKVKIRA